MSTLLSAYTGAQASRHARWDFQSALLALDSILVNFKLASEADQPNRLHW